MAKQHEIDYPHRMNAEHAANKPFSDRECGRNLIRVGALVALLPPPPARVLDLGCGTGWTTLFFARAGYDAVGVDIAPEMVRLAERQRAAAGVASASFRVCDYESLAFDSEFDAAVFFDALHHAEDERLAVGRAFAALKPGGILLAEEPGEGHSAAEWSVTAVAQFGVTEKDMPPARVVELGREAGFTAFRAFPHPDELVAAVLAPQEGPASDPFATPSRLGAVERLLSRVRSHGLVAMWKPAAG